MTTRVGDLTEHLRTHTKDYASRRGLLMMVSRRRRLLDYLKKVDPQRYLDVLRPGPTYMPNEERLAAIEAYER